MKRTSSDMHAKSLKMVKKFLNSAKGYMMPIFNGRKGLDRDVGDFSC